MDGRGPVFSAGLDGKDNGAGLDDGTLNDNISTGRDDGTGRRDWCDDGFTVPSRSVPPLPSFPSRKNTAISLANNKSHKRVCHTNDEAFFYRG